MPGGLGVLLIVGGVGYVAQCITAIVFPAYHGLVFNVTLPIVAPGELFAINWLLIRGGRVPLPQARPAHAT